MKKKLLSIFAAFSVLASTMPFAGAVSITDFTDVNPSDWHYNAVKYAVDKSLFNGTSETLFSPEESMTRGMFVTVLYRLKNNNIDFNPSNFTDVPRSAYYYDAIAWAADNQIVSGTSATTFSPDETITREQIAKILYGYADMLGTDITAPTTQAYTSFSDYASVSNYAQTAMKWAVHNKIINGDNGRLNPQALATRAQVATMFMNAENLLKSNNDENENGNNNSGSEDNKGNENNTTGENGNTTPELIKDETDKRPTGVSEIDAYGGYWDYDLSNATFDAVNELRKDNGCEPLAYSLKVGEWADIRAYELAKMNYNEMHGTPHIRPNGNDYKTVGQGVDAENALLRGHSKTVKELTQYDENGNAYIELRHTVTDENGIGYFETKRYTIEEYLEYAGNDVAMQWHNSQKHKNTMLNKSYASGAIGIYIKDGNAYGIQLFSNQPVYIINGYK